MSFWSRLADELKGVVVPVFESEVMALSDDKINAAIAAVPVLGKIEAALPPEMKAQFAEALKAGAVALLQKL